MFLWTTTSLASSRLNRLAVFDWFFTTKDTEGLPGPIPKHPSLTSHANPGLKTLVINNKAQVDTELQNRSSYVREAFKIRNKNFALEAEGGSGILSIIVYKFKNTFMFHALQNLKTIITCPHQRRRDENTHVYVMNSQPKEEATKCKMLKKWQHKVQSKWHPPTRLPHKTKNALISHGLK